MPHVTPFSETELEGEKWKPIIEFPGYDVSNLGRVRSWRTFQGKIGTTFHILKPSFCGGQRKKIAPRRNCKTFSRAVHILVLNAFISPRPKGKLACHEDDNCWNNRLWNLKWATPEENHKDQKRNNKIPRGEQHGNAKLTEKIIIDIRNRHANGEKTSHLAKEYGIPDTDINRIKRGDSWKHVGGPTYNPKTKKGIANGLAKLTEDQVREIRKRSKAGQSANSMAKVLNMHRTTIQAIVARRNWRHII